MLPHSDAFELVDAARKDWLAGKIAAADLPAKQWTTHEWVHFLDGMPAKVPAAKLAELDAAFALTATGNSEIAFSWLRIAIRNDYAPACAAARELPDHHRPPQAHQAAVRGPHEDAGRRRARPRHLRARAA